MVIMPEVVVQVVIKRALDRLKHNEATFKKIFEQFTTEDMSAFYGENYVDGIWKWFQETKIPVMQAYSFDVDKIPCYTIHLSTESEDESKAATSDYFGMGESSDMLTGVDTVMLDIQIMGHRSKDYVLWLHYILKYILFINKMDFINNGLQLHTYSITDYSKQNQYNMENVWSRTVKFRCTVQNTFESIDEYVEIEEVETFIQDERDSDTGDYQTTPPIKPERFRE